MKNWIQSWVIIPVAGISFSGYRLYRAMKAAAPPGCIAWSIDLDADYERQHLAWGNSDYGYWPVPKHPGHVCVFDPGNPDYPAKGASGFGWLAEDVASCTYKPATESDLVIGLRIWHEVLHCMLGSGEPDQMTETPGFVAFLERKFGADDPWVFQFRANPALYAHDPYYQKEFYAYLVEVHFRDEASAPPIRPPVQYLIRDVLEEILSFVRKKTGSRSR